MVADPARLLPSNRTTLETALASTMPRSRLEEQAGLPASIKTRRPVALTPWLVAEWGLADFARYFDSTEKLIDAGLPWLMKRGTAMAVKEALAWIKLDAVTLEEDGARLQLDTNRAIDVNTLPSIKHLIERSIPAHEQLYRLYHGYDLRPHRLDYALLNDALLDDDSGVVRDGVKLSFGTRVSAALMQESLAAAWGGMHSYSTRVWDDNDWRADAWRLDSEVWNDAASGLVAQYSAFAPFAEDSTHPYARLDRYAHLLRLETDSLQFSRFDRYALQLQAEQDAPQPYGRWDRYARRLQQEADPVHPAAGRSGYVHSLQQEAELTGAQDRSDRAAATVARDERMWIGRWIGGWREDIPRKTTFEEA